MDFNLFALFENKPAVLSEVTQERRVVFADTITRLAQAYEHKLEETNGDGPQAVRALFDRLEHELTVSPIRAGAGAEHLTPKQKRRLRRGLRRSLDQLFAERAA